MKQHRSKLHPSSCFPSNPSVPNTQNRLFVRIAPARVRQSCSRLTFVGINATTYSTIAALLAYRPLTSIECINIFDIYQNQDGRTTLNDLRLIALLSRSNTRLQCVQSYWETKDSTIIIINVQHYRLETESISSWIQMNASLVETVVSQVCLHSPHATLIICTQPNELMTYVASRVSQFPTERVFGLGASVDTAYAHRTILDRAEKIHGRVNGYFLLGDGLATDSCTTALTHHLTIDGICCSDIYSKSMINKTEIKSTENQSSRKREKVKSWDLIKILKRNDTLYSNIRRRSPIITDLISRQQTATKYLRSIFTTLPSESKPLESFEFAFNTKPRSNWTEAMLILHIVRAILHDCEFQSNFVVNIAPIHHSNNVFVTYPTIIGSSNRAIEYMLPFHQAEHILKERTFLIPYDKLQRQIRLSESKD